MRPVTWGLVIIIVGVFVLEGLVPLVTAPKGELQMQQALSAADASFGLSARDLVQLAARLVDVGAGSERDTRAIVYWLVCSRRVPQDSIEKFARLALVRVAVQGASPKEAVRDQVSLLTAGSPDPFKNCPIGGQ